MNSIKFSVIIPNYKRTTELVRAIQSVLNQELSAELLDSIIIVDDNSENINKITAAVERLNSSKIEMVNNNYKSNAAATRNQGAKLAKTEWVCFLDSDDVFLPGKLIALSNVINSGADVYYNKAQVYFDSMLESIVPSRPLGQTEHISDFLFTSKELMQTSTLTVRKSFFEESGFNDKYVRHQDYDLCLSLQEKGLKFEFVDTVGTAIFWSSKDRPNAKGESFDYSNKWLIENESRMSLLAKNEFFYQFVVLKSARNKNKLYSLKNINAKNMTAKRLAVYCAILIIPNFLQHLCYVAFKRIKCYVKRSKNL